MRKFIINLFISFWLFVEKLGLNIISIPSIKPDEKTSEALSLLKRICTKAEDVGIRVWLTGSWAITGRNGGYFKNIRDIDFTMQTREDEVMFGNLLVSLGLTKIKDSPMGANRYVDLVSDITVDFGSVTHPGTYYQIPLKENEFVTLDGFSFRVIPSASHVNIYKHILFNKGRSVFQDLIKIKILCLK